MGNQITKEMMEAFTIFEWIFKACSPRFKAFLNVSVQAEAVICLFMGKLPEDNLSA